ncbi:hypothetical protein EK546_09425 [Salmonella enterica]|nr:hypothetical protein [Salmonella enterica]
MFNRIITNYTLFWLKPLKFERAVGVIDWTVIWSFIFILVGLNTHTDVPYLFMELRNSLIAGGY